MSELKELVQELAKQTRSTTNEYSPFLQIGVVQELTNGNTCTVETLDTFTRNLTPIELLDKNITFNKSLYYNVRYSPDPNNASIQPVTYSLVTFSFKDPDNAYILVIGAIGKFVAVSEDGKSKTEVTGYGVTTVSDLYTITGNTHSGSKILKDGYSLESDYRGSYIRSKEGSIVNLDKGIQILASPTGKIRLSKTKTTIVNKEVEKVVNNTETDDNKVLFIQYLKFNAIYINTLYDGINEEFGIKQGGKGNFREKYNIYYDRLKNETGNLDPLFDALALKYSNTLPTDGYAGYSTIFQNDFEMYNLSKNVLKRSGEYNKNVYNELIKLKGYIDNNINKSTRYDFTFFVLFRFKLQNPYFTFYVDVLDKLYENAKGNPNNPFSDNQKSTIYNIINNKIKEVEPYKDRDEKVAYIEEELSIAKNIVSIETFETYSLYDILQEQKMTIDYLKDAIDKLTTVVSTGLLSPSGNVTVLNPTDITSIKNTLSNVKNEVGKINTNIENLLEK